VIVGEFQEAFNLTHRHPLGVHRDDLVIEASKALLPFADELTPDF
jgi:hypothetical protein